MDEKQITFARVALLECACTHYAHLRETLKRTGELTAKDQYCVVSGAGLSLAETNEIKEKIETGAIQKLINDRLIVPTPTATGSYISTIYAETGFTEEEMLVQLELYRLMQEADDVDFPEEVPF